MGSEMCIRDSFNADGFTDVSDFNIWNNNNFQSSADGVSSVPEPSAAILLLVGAFGLLRLSGRKTRNA